MVLSSRSIAANRAQPWCPHHLQVEPTPHPSPQNLEAKNQKQPPINHILLEGLTSDHVHEGVTKNNEWNSFIELN